MTAAKAGGCASETPWHIVVHGKWRPERSGSVPQHSLCGASFTGRTKIDRAAARHVLATRPDIAANLCAECVHRMECK